MNSLDPRVNRLPKTGQPGQILSKAPLDQFGTFEVFVQPKEGKPFQHEGIVHAPDLEMAFVLAKEAFTRRFSCTALCVTDTRNVFVTPMTDGTHSAYDSIIDPEDDRPSSETFEIFHLLKRGKQHVHAGRVNATDPLQAISRARKQFGETLVYNIWAVRSADMRFSRPDEKDLWLTLPEKKFRDATEYKGGEKLKAFLESRRT